MLRLALLAPILGLFSFALPARSDLLPPAWVGSFGTQITSWTSGNADDGIKTVSLNAVNSSFSFSFGGTNYISATVSTNGFVSLGSPTTTDSQPVATPFELTSGAPRVAPAWYDVNAAASGSIWFNNSIPGEVVFTWLNVGSYAPPPGQSVATSNEATFQVVLKQSGTVVLSYDEFNTLSSPSPNSISGSPAALIGLSTGQGATDPGATNIAQLTSAASMATSTTVYSILNSSSGVDLSGTDFVFTPNGVNHFSVTAESSSQISVTSVPEPSTVLFAVAGIGMLALFARKGKG